MIQIARITLKNFRQFKDVELRFKDSKGVYLFMGDDQGVGKSNFMNAVYWCLYEEEPFKTDQGNKEIVNELVEDDSDSKTEVSIEVHGDKSQLLIKRTKIGRQNPSLTILMKREENWMKVEKVDNPLEIINSFLPQSVSNFFLFDGESVGRIFNTTTASNLKRGILKVSHIQVVENSINHLDAVISELRRNTSKGLPDLERLREKIDSKKSEIDNLEKKKKISQDQLDIAKNNYEKLRDKQTIIAKFTEQTKRRADLESDFENTNTQLKDVQDLKKEKISQYMHYLVSMNAIDDFIGNIQKQQKENKIPPRVASQFVHELIHSPNCICENPIGEKERHALQKLLDESELADEKKFLLDESSTLKGVVRSEIKSEADTFEWLMKQEIDLTNSLNSINKKLKEVNEELRSSEDIDIASLQKQIDQFKDEIDNGGRTIAEITSEINTGKYVLEQDDKNYQELLSKNDVLQKEYKMMQKASLLKETLTMIYDEIIFKVRDDLNKHTDGYFKELLGNKDKFQKVYFSEDYEVNVIKPNSSDNVFNMLATGERKLLGYATLKALGELSGFSEVPVFIDGPIENLSELRQQNFLEKLNEFMPNKQLFIFSHDHASIKDYARDNIDRDHWYKLMVEDVHGSKVTKIVKYEGN